MSHPKHEKTLVVIKPDGVQRSLIGEIIKRFEKSGLKLVGMKMIVPTEDHVRKHYTLEDGWIKSVGEKSINAYKEKGMEPPTTDPIESGERVLGVLVKYLSSGPVVAMVIQGSNAVKIVRKLVGNTEPLTSDVGTIRGDFVIDSYDLADLDKRAVRNLIHASGTTIEAEREISAWFNEGEVLDYKLVQEGILYDVNMDGILE
jgi:nucleoside-diphosphate kinase